MSIRVRGTMIVSRKTGRRGAFNVAELRTEIGHFEVKDVLIEEYEEGQYTGDFFITWIEPDSVAWRGKVFVKNRAQLEAIIVDDAEEGAPAPAPSMPPEVDPAEASPSASPRLDDLVSSSSSAEPTAPQRDGTTEQSEPSDKSLFGDDLYPLLLRREPIKLDPTVDRLAFRAQRDRLKALGYGFNVKAQTWTAAQ